MTRLEAARAAVIARAMLKRVYNGRLVITSAGIIHGKTVVSGVNWLKWETYRDELHRMFAPVIKAPYDWRAWWSAGATTLAKEAARLVRHARYTKAEW